MSFSQHFKVVIYFVSVLFAVRAQTDCTVQRDPDGNEYGFCSSEFQPGTRQSYSSATSRGVAGAAGPAGEAGAAGAAGAVGAPSPDGAQAEAAPLPAGVTLNQAFTPADVAGYCSTCGITRCYEQCSWYKYYWVYYLGLWRPIYHYGAIVQYIQTCWCRNPYQICWNWQGRCVTKYTQARILIWFGWSTRWVYVRVPTGCCCVPWYFGSVGVQGAAGAPGVAGAA